MDEEVTFLNRQAARCRRLARETADLKSAEQLDLLAAEYDRRAEVLRGQRSEQPEPQPPVPVPSPRT